MGKNYENPLRHRETDVKNYNFPINVIYEATPENSLTVFLWAIENDFTLMIYRGWK